MKASTSTTAGSALIPREMVGSSKFSSTVVCVGAEARGFPRGASGRRSPNIRTGTRSW